MFVLNPVQVRRYCHTLTQQVMNLILLKFKLLKNTHKCLFCYLTRNCLKFPHQIQNLLTRVLPSLQNLLLQNQLFLLSYFTVLSNKLSHFIAKNVNTDSICVWCITIRKQKINWTLFKEEWVLRQNGFEVFCSCCFIWP